MHLKSGSQNLGIRHGRDDHGQGRRRPGQRFTHRRGAEAERVLVGVHRHRHCYCGKGAIKGEDNAGATMWLLAMISPTAKKVATGRVKKISIYQ